MKQKFFEIRNMSFFDKLLSHLNKSSKNENELKLGSEPLRECDRRGRKLLFDSNAVEKITLPVEEIMCNQKCQHISNKKCSDFIETTATHGYKYKKLSNDVSCLGEMIFGSVAMMYKGENSCKIHKIPEPKQLMFTTIVLAPVRCHLGAVNEHSLESSSSSINDITNEKENSSSDSKLYKNTGIDHKCSSTYPCLKNNLAPNKIAQCCDANQIKLNCMKKLLVPKDYNLDCATNLSNSTGNNANVCNVQEEKIFADNVELEKDFLILNLTQKNSSGNTATLPSVGSSESEISSISGSLSSLRRRWTQSSSTSLDLIRYDDLTDTPCKKRAKLGMSLLIDISSSNDNDLEVFLFNHTIIIDSIMSKLQSSVELAYIKNQSFVDLIYSAFLDAQETIFDIIMSSKYTVPTWVTLTEDLNSEIEDDDVSGADDDSLHPSFREMTLSEKNFKKNKKSGTSDCFKIKFLNDFCDVLVKFDTKDTNFFISTLITAVLTHHLSWVSSIAETNISNRHEKLQSVIKNYNPIWAQLNDLYGLLGSPLKCAKTILTGGESKKNHITAILQVLTYFIRCYNVIENTFDVNFEEIVEEAQSSDSFDWDFNSGLMNSCEKAQEKTEKFLVDVSKSLLREPESEKLKIQSLEQDNEKKVYEKQHDIFQPGKSLKRNKTCLGQLNIKESENCLEIKEKTISNTEMENYKYSGAIKKILSDSSLIAKNNEISDSVKLPSYLEESISPDEGCSNINFNKTDINYGRKQIAEIQESSISEPKNNIVFLLGDNEKLTDLHKKIVLSKPDLIELEKEDYENFLIKSDLIKTDELNSTSVLANSENKSVENKRTFNNVDGRECSDDIIVANGSQAKKSALYVPWLTREINMPSSKLMKPCRRKFLEINAAFGGVNQGYNSEQIVQGIINSKGQWEQKLQKDLLHCAYKSTIEKDISEALCIIGDVDLWEVTVRSSSNSILEKHKNVGVRVGMSQLVSDMLESLVCLHKINLSPNFCFYHLEKKLREIYLKSRTVAELLDSTELCTIEFITEKLGIGINDIPLLLSVATTHSPHISKKYGLSFT